ncbi:DUF885 domain-containing protein [Parashewanella curva]|uniref:DUF885 domain-containing protein n=1 Tax=Parashewanella curva TaxID=2338552 RepID=A0A3L8PTM1_9GAMM|nr:DUF885 domain-containing protein [Parashewanella curva]RLV58159.1 DUF885 domain-containing protein [Parashewanella curva]
MKKSLLALALTTAIVGVTACSGSSNIEPVQPPLQTQIKNQAFVKFSDQFIENLWKQFPTWAIYSGYHKYDDQLVIPNENSRIQTLSFVKKQRDALKQIKLSTLTTSQSIDYRLIENVLDKVEWGINSAKAWQWNPAQYNVAGGFAQIINEDFAPLDHRLKSVLNRMKYVADYYQAAKNNIFNPTLEHTQLAIQQNKGGLGVFSDELIQKAEASGLSDADKKLFAQRVKRVRTAINGYVTWLLDLEKDLTKNGARSFRIGEKLYEQKFALDIQSGMTAKQLYTKAVADKNRVQAEMVKLTDELWPKYFSEPQPTDKKQAVRMLIDKLSVRHVKRDDFVAEVKKQIPELVDFVNKKQLITLDPSKPLVVRETPAYMRGFAGASISAPGPYDKHGNTYYNVTPLDAMTEAQAESYLREYNHWILQILNIHEAIPGHYTQLVYSNESPSLVKSLFGNGAMVEGWAVYTERMMLEEGYSNFEPEMWLMYYKWNLRVICNTILDYSIQVKGMTKQQGLDLLMNEAFQERAEAEGKWRRATLSQVQLTSYYSGYREIYDFREEYKQRLGSKFDLRQFHEKFLSYGSAPVKYIRQQMLSELN